MNRRRFLQAASVGGIVTIAGCSDTAETESPGAGNISGTDDAGPSSTGNESTDQTEESAEDPVESFPENPLSERTLSQRIGATHVSSKYHFRDDIDMLNEGASVLEELGCRVFKGWIYHMDAQYPFVEWPEFNSLTEVVQHDYFQELFERDFDVYVFNATAYTSGVDRGGWGYLYHEFTSRDAIEVEEAFYSLTKYLLETYDGEEIEFVLKNWEGDWILIGGTGQEGPPEKAVLDRGKRWWNARQRGIVRAREEVESSVAVLGGCEINRVIEPKEDGTEWIVNTILSDLEVDLVSYSAWDLCRRVAEEPPLDDDSRSVVPETLDYILENAPDRTEYAKSVFGDDIRPVFIGEYGLPKLVDDINPTMQAVRGVTEESLAWGVPYTLFWQVYDNEMWVNGERVTLEPDIESILEEEFADGVGMDDVLGFYLVRPNGHRASTWYYFANLLETNQSEFIQITLDFESVVSEAELAPNVDEEYARDLAFYCRELTVESGSERVTFDIGGHEERVAYKTGVYPPEEPAEGVSSRWFGGPEERTVIYVPTDGFSLENGASALELYVSAVHDGLEVTVSLPDSEPETLVVDEELRRYLIAF